MNAGAGKTLHPYHMRRRAYQLELSKELLSPPVEGKTNYLCAAELGYKDEAIRARIVGLDELANRLLVLGLHCIERVFATAPEPHATTMIEYWDDKDLSYHWSEAYRCRYEIRLLMDGRSEKADLLGGMDRLERLFRATNGFTNKVRSNKAEILAGYLWMAILAGESDRAVERTTGILDISSSREAPVRGFRRCVSYGEMLCLVLRFARGESNAGSAARRSLQKLLTLHRDLENEIQLLKYSGPVYGFRWSWLWEVVFEESPSVDRAIERLRVMVPDDGAAA